MPSTFSAWAREIIEPICVSSASGSPTRSAPAFSANAATNSSWTASSTRMRERASHDCPAE